MSLIERSAIVALFTFGNTCGKKRRKTGILGVRPGCSQNAILRHALDVEELTVLMAPIMKEIICLALWRCFLFVAYFSTINAVVYCFKLMLII